MGAFPADHAVPKMLDSAIYDGARKAAHCAPWELAPRRSSGHLGFPRRPAGVPGS